MIRRLGFGLLLALLVVHSAFAAGDAKPGDHSATMSSGGVDRTYIVHVPKGYQPGTPVPFVLLLHGLGGSGTQALHDYGWDTASDAHGFICVAPDGLPPRPDDPTSFQRNPRRWHSRTDIQGGVDDVAFLTALIGKVESDYSIDTHRVYIAGMSNGAQMTFLMGVTLADSIAAIGPVSFYNATGATQLKRPLSLFYVTGTADPLDPMAGGDVTLPWGTTYTKPDTEQSVVQ